MSGDIVNTYAKRLLLFDGHALAFNSWFTSYPNRVTPGFFDMVRDSVKRYEPTHIIVTFDPPPPTFRHIIYPNYKANRPPVPEGLLEGCDEVRDKLKSLGIIFITVEGYEADDTLGTLAYMASTSGFDTRIVTSDLDLLQLVAPNIRVEVFSQYWPTRFFDEDSARRRFYGVEPRYIPDYKALAGDKSDNLPGVPGIGDVSASALLTQYQNLDEIYDKLGDVYTLKFRGAKRVAKLLEQYREQAFMMRTLTTINCNIPIDKSLSQSVMQEAYIECKEINW